ncbi:Uncharacterised protein [Mycobacterium tuberculosis]|nr:Uncharacterised protein [Mycobacterium tuberculosis]
MAAAIACSGHSARATSTLKTPLFHMKSRPFCARNGRHSIPSPGTLWYSPNEAPKKTPRAAASAASRRSTGRRRSMSTPQTNSSGGSSRKLMLASLP